MVCMHTNVSFCVTLTPFVSDWSLCVVPDNVSILLLHIHIFLTLKSKRKKKQKQKFLSGLVDWSLVKKDGLFQFFFFFKFFFTHYLPVLPGTSSCTKKGKTCNNSDYLRKQWGCDCLAQWSSFSWLLCPLSLHLPHPALHRAIPCGMMSIWLSDHFQIYFGWEPCTWHGKNSETPCHCRLMLDTHEPCDNVGCLATKHGYMNSNMKRNMFHQAVRLKCQIPLPQIISESDTLNLNRLFSSFSPDLGTFLQFSLKDSLWKKTTQLLLT